MAGVEIASIHTFGDGAEGLREEPLPDHIGGRRPLAGWRIAAEASAEGDGILRKLLGSGILGVGSRGFGGR